jgi:hypothetical protein
MLTIRRVTRFTTAVTFVLGILTATGLRAQDTAAEDPVFSGPQKGEKLAGFQMRLAYEEKQVDPVEQAGGKPILVMFVHQLTRPSVATVRSLGNYAAKRHADGLQTSVVFLGDDMTALSDRLQAARRAMPTDVAIGMSIDGSEGPGSYGLNRNVTLTILLAKDNKVSANFALKDPSVQADVPKVAAAICELIGGTPPKLEELVPQAMRARVQAANAGNMSDEKLNGLLRSLVRNGQSAEDVQKAATAIEDYIKDSPQAKRALAAVLQRIQNANGFDNFPEAARVHLKKWAEAYGAKTDRRPGGTGEEPVRGKDGSSSNEY